MYQLESPAPEWGAPGASTPGAPTHQVEDIWWHMPRGGRSSVRGAVRSMRNAEEDKVK